MTPSIISIVVSVGKVENMEDKTVLKSRRLKRKSEVILSDFTCAEIFGHKVVVYPISCRVGLIVNCRLTQGAMEITKRKDQIFL